ncbi:MAG: NADPH-dependent assimilatory sulfite reductase hemoprotein subunit [Ardenticatenaceae bacterium]|nr:NADPH-dependent assimilatory sulfite reductase hemoprotein subunit [Ardenticatenaceae bacterium]
MPSKVEVAKEKSNYLYGTLAQELDKTTSHFEEDNRQVLKFHGIYQQDDREQRRERKAAGEEPAYQFMVRSKLPGGALTAEQYLVHDDLADRYANGTLRITTRQGFQFHGVLKGDLKATLRELNSALVSTLAACGDVERNVMCCPAPTGDPVRQQLQQLARAIAAHLEPRTRAYHKIWLNGEEVKFADDGRDEEPVYGKTYLPRKFKTAVAYPGDNCVDVLTNDLGLIAVLDQTGTRIKGYTLVVGGSMGTTHGKEETFPALARPIGFVRPEDAIKAAEAVVIVQRDYGDRNNRRHARLKYLIHDRGLAWFRERVEEVFGRPLEDPRPLPPFETHDHLGWGESADGTLWLGLPIENGRVADIGHRRLRTSLRRLVETYRPRIFLTPQHNILLVGLDPANRVAIEFELFQHGIATVNDISGVRRHEMACPALPTCGLAIAEAERVLPDVIDQLEWELEQLGLGDETISIRMTGCPNGCARPYVAELAFVGRSLNKYQILVGGDFNGMRLNVLYADLVHLEDLAATVRPLLALWRDWRRPGEGFGDFTARLGVDALRSYANEWKTAQASQAA